MRIDKLFIGEYGPLKNLDLKFSAMTLITGLNERGKTALTDLLIQSIFPKPKNKKDAFNDIWEDRFEKKQFLFDVGDPISEKKDYLLQSLLTIREGKVLWKGHYASSINDNHFWNIDVRELFFGMDESISLIHKKLPKVLGVSTKKSWMYHLHSTLLNSSNKLSRIQSIFTTINENEHILKEYQSKIESLNLIIDKIQKQMDVKSFAQQKNLFDMIRKTEHTRQSLEEKIANLEIDKTNQEKIDTWNKIQNNISVHQNELQNLQENLKNLEQEIKYAKDYLYSVGINMDLVGKKSANKTSVLIGSIGFFISLFFFGSSLLFFQHPDLLRVYLHLTGDQIAFTIYLLGSIGLGIFVSSYIILISQFLKFLKRRKQEKSKKDSHDKQKAIKDYKTGINNHKKTQEEIMKKISQLQNLYQSVEEFEKENGSYASLIKTYEQKQNYHEQLDQIQIQEKDYYAILKQNFGVDIKDNEHINQILADLEEKLDKMEAKPLLDLETNENLSSLLKEREILHTKIDNIQENNFNMDQEIKNIFNTNKQDIEKEFDDSYAKYFYHPIYQFIKNKKVDDIVVVSQKLQEFSKQVGKDIEIAEKISKLHKQYQYRIDNLVEETIQKTYLKTYLSYLTNKEYDDIQVHIEKEKIDLFLHHKADGALYNLSELSTATLDQFFLAFRFALSRAILKDRPGLAIIDDALLTFDIKRKQSAISFFKYLVSQNWQIVYLGVDEGTIRQLFDHIFEHKLSIYNI